MNRGGLATGSLPDRNLQAAENRVAHDYNVG